MTFTAGRRPSSGGEHPGGVPAGMERSLVLLSGGPAEPLQTLLAEAAPLLAEAWGLPLRQLGADGGSSADTDPASALAQLNQQPPGLAWLPRDPGSWSGPAGTWAQALGAWRQPAVALIPAAELSGGLAASLTALLRQERVPLLGLVQWQGSWQSELRRADGLPWLGHWPGAGDDPDQRDQAIDALDLVLQRRWQGLGS